MIHISVLCRSQPTVVPTAADWQAVTDRRLDLLSAVCKNSSLRNLTHVSISKFVLDRIFVCDKHKILFCQTPKVGNTQWKKVLIVLNGKYEPDEGGTFGESYSNWGSMTKHFRKPKETF